MEITVMVSAATLTIEKVLGMIGSWDEKQVPKWQAVSTLESHHQHQVPMGDSTPSFMTNNNRTMEIGN